MITLREFIETNIKNSELGDHYHPGHFIYNSNNVLYDAVFGKNAYGKPSKYEEFINESLTMTFDPIKTIEIVGDFFKKDLYVNKDIILVNIQDPVELNNILDKHNIEFDKNKEQIVFIKYKHTNGDCSESLEAVKKAFQYCGYYFSHSQDRENFEWLYFYPKFQINVNKHVKKENKILWHLTTKDIAEKILKNGFVPKSTNELYDYPGRIHLMKENTPRNVKLGLVEQFKEQNKFNAKSEKDNRSKNPELLDFVEIKIDVKKLPKNANFYIDPDFSKYGIFTYENISPKAIVDIQPI